MSMPSRPGHLRNLACAVAAAICAAASVHARQADAVASDWLQIVGVLPAETYDPNTSQIPRRRPGHPYVPPPQFTIQNPDGVPPAPIDQVGSFIPVPNRWRIMETLGFKFPWYDPYDQNIWKGDKPIDGKDHFLAFNVISDTVLQPRTMPTPVGPQSPSQPGQNDMLGRVRQNVFLQTIIASVDYYKGDTVFKPPEYEFKATLALNYSRVNVQQVRALQIDPRLGQTRDDGFLGVQELFYLTSTCARSTNATTSTRCASASSRSRPISAASCSRTASSASASSATATTTAGSTTWRLSAGSRRTSTPASTT